MLVMYSFVHKTFPCLLEMVLIIKGYRAIGLPLYSDESKAMHYIYIKEHAEKIMRDSAEQKKKARILFVGNVDYKRNMSHEDIDQYLRILFFRFGDVVSVSVSSIDHLKNISSRFAHVTFAKKSALLAALNASNAEYLDAGREVASTFGLKRTVKSVEEIRSLHSFVNENPAELKEEVDEFMKEFEENELSEKQDAEKKSSEADNDGFMPVKSRNKRKKVAPVDSKQRSRKKRKTLELKNFYRFQIRQEKVEKLEELRKKFEEDKRRVAIMKEARNFKPF